MKSTASLVTTLCLSLIFTCACRSIPRRSCSYAIIVSEATLNTSGWSEVVAALESKHIGAQRLVYADHPTELLPQLQQSHPRYTCFVGRPSEVSRDFVREIHRLTAAYDSDPYTDTLWAILTGYDAANALRIAGHNQPLTIRKVASGTEIALEMVEQGGWYDELEAGKKVWKEPGHSPVQTKVPQDTTRALVDTLNLWQADCLVASGHATEHNWQLGYRYKNGYFKCEKGAIYGEDTNQVRHPVNSPNPKIYLPVGNCLMGHIDGPDAMALAWMNSAGVHQMIGYIQPTWFGYAGWGCLDYFIEQPGRYTLIEAFFANHHALVHKLRSEPSKGLEFDRDHVAIYGDPAWSAKMAAAACCWEQRLDESNGLFTLTITPNRGRASFLPVNTNGSQRGGRPVVAYLPRRISKPRIIQGAEHTPVITDDFILVPNPGKDYDGKEIIIRFTGTEVGPASS
ncbi:MAG: hypothetical protein PHO37_01615 [Kiritimatiellae bacterium]|nr:hypothetical protein [Kiritimatiellia bacterium]